MVCGERSSLTHQETYDLIELFLQEGAHQTGSGDEPICIGIQDCIDQHLSSATQQELDDLTTESNCECETSTPPTCPPGNPKLIFQSELAGITLCLPSCSFSDPCDFEDEFKRLNCNIVPDSEEEWWDDLVDIAIEAWEQACDESLDPCGGGGVPPDPVPDPPNDPPFPDPDPTPGSDPYPPYPEDQPIREDPGDGELPPGNPQPGASNEGPGPCQTALTSDPVDLGLGSKAEYAEDIRVTVRGPDFVIQRHNTSNLAHELADLVGEGHSLNVFAFVKADHHIDGTAPDAQWYVWTHGHDASRLFKQDDSVSATTTQIPADGTLYHNEGPSRDTIESGEYSFSGKTWAVWKHVSPGEWTRYYYRYCTSCVGVETIGSELDGLLLAEEDPYGNRRVYRYYNLPGTTTPRLKKIMLNPTSLASTSTNVRLYWHEDGANAGRLKSIRVMRLEWTGSTAEVVDTQKLDYTYANSDGSWGTTGDLLKVYKRVRLNTGGAAGSFRKTATVYRYHNESLNEDATDDDDGDGFKGEKGSDHQIKMIIRPEQVEWFAHDGGFTSISAAASAIMNADDGDTLAFTGGVPSGGSGPKTHELAAKVITKYELASEDTRKRVLEQFVQTDCACASGSGRKLAYEYWDYPSSSTPSNTVKIEEYYTVTTPYDTLRHTTYHDMARPGGDGGTPYIHHKAIIEPDPDTGDPNVNGRMWVTHYERDSTAHYITREDTPSVCASYTPGEAPTTGQPNGVLPVYTRHTDQGLSLHYAYNSDKQLIRTLVAKGTGTPVKIQETTYGSTSDDVMRRLPIKSERFTDSMTETTEYDYGFFVADTFEIAWVKNTTTAETEAQNGPGGTYISYDIRDTYGNNTYRIAADGAITKRTYDNKHGERTKIETNADNDLASPYHGLTTSGFGRHTDGGSLVTEHEYDALGRVTATTRPGGKRASGGPVGIKSYTVRTVAQNDDLGHSLYAVVSSPPLIDLGGGVYEYGGPLAHSWYNAGGRVVATRTRELTGTVTAGTASGVGVDLNRSAAFHSVLGTVESSRVWHDATDNDAYDESLYSYNTLGQLDYEVDPNGTVIQYTYDVLGRKKTESIGLYDDVNDEPDSSTMKVVAEFFYDGEEADPDAYGNDNITKVVRPIDDQSSNDRITTYAYDYRDRRITTENPEGPHEFVVYDRQGRITKTALFEELPTGIEPSDVDTNLSKRKSYSEIHYSKRGLVYRSGSALDPTSASPAMLESHFWYDKNGREVKSLQPGGTVLKTAYDGLGRSETTYLTDGGGDVAPGGTGNHSHADDVTGDVVLKQVDSTYFEDGGLLDLVTIRRRAHHIDDTDTGELQSLTDPDGAITTFYGYYYDRLNRVDREINFGTNDTASGAVYEAGGTAPTWPPSSYDSYTDASYSDYLITGTEYDIAGRISVSIDPNSIKTKFLYDGYNRVYATIENLDDSDEPTISWATSDRWEVTSGLDYTKPDTNRITTLVYDGVGNITHRVAHFPDDLDNEDVQITEYVYGVTTGTGGSEINSNGLLSEVRYPIESGTSAGEPGTTDAYKVKHTYNRQGDQLAIEDQNQTKHSYEYDDAGRLTKDTITTYGSGIDQTVESIQYTYDDFGRQESIESLDDTDTVLNEVQFTYHESGPIEYVYQDHNGSVQKDGSGNPTGDTVRVAYDYDESGIAFDNHLRLSSVTYPDGSTQYDNIYSDATGSIDDSISRLTEFKINGESQALVAYEYVEHDIAAVVDYADIDVRLDNTVADNGSRSDGGYQAWDTFGRPIRLTWIDGGLTTHNTYTTVPDVPPIVSYSYTYDDAGNVLTRRDIRPGLDWSHRDEQFAYDDLHRIIEADRGVDTGSGFDHHSSSQQWTLDVLGNWADHYTGANLAGTSFTAHEERDHNYANEINDRDTDADGTADLLATYDDAGNITSQQIPASGGGTTTINYVHDAWNRLVEVKYGTTVRSQFAYNGLHHRIVKTADVRGATSSDPPDGTIDEQRLMYYGASWDLLEERIDDDYDEITYTEEQRNQYFWGGRGTDDIVAQRVDTNANGTYDDRYYHLTDRQFSTLVLLDDSADVVERMTYDAQGLVSHYWPTDANGDGRISVADSTLVTNISSSSDNAIGELDYDAAADFNRDGIVDVRDVVATTQAALPGGQISSVGNILGFQAMVFNPETNFTYLARHRWYDTELGRWIQRDPAGYVDGMSMYLFIGGNPLVAVDPLGLFFDPCAFSQEAWDFLGGAGQGIYEGVKDEVTHQVMEAMEEQRKKSIEERLFELLSPTGAVAANQSKDIAEGVAVLAESIVNDGLSSTASDMWEAAKNSRSGQALGDIGSGLTSVMDDPTGAGRQFGHGAGVLGVREGPDAAVSVASGGVGMAAKGAKAARAVDNLADMRTTSRLDNVATNRPTRSQVLDSRNPAVGSVYKNSLNYAGETHVYSVKGPNGAHKIGQSSQGTRVRDGASIRAEQQVRQLIRDTGQQHSSQIRKVFPDKRSAREYETRFIERFRRIYGDGALPGNKTNH